MQGSHSRRPRGLGVMAALALAGCATTPPVGPQTHTRSRAQVAPQVEAQASAFASFMSRARAIDPAFSGPAAVSQGLQTGAGYDPKQLEAGMVAFAAVAALQDQAFVAAVRREARNSQHRRDLSQRLATRPAEALQLPGAGGAAARARAALFHQAAGLAEGGRKVKAASYSLQRNAWAKVFVKDAPARLSRVKATAKAVRPPNGEDQARLYHAVAEASGRGGGSSEVVVHGVALAALSVLDGGKGAGLLNEPKAGMCVRLAKLNFHQCLASAGPYYEDVYCLGQHAMIEPAQCVAAAAGAAPAGK